MGWGPWLEVLYGEACWDESGSFTLSWVIKLSPICSLFAPQMIVEYLQLTVSMEMKYWNSA